MWLLCTSVCHIYLHSQMFLTASVQFVFGFVTIDQTLLSITWVNFSKPIHRFTFLLLWQMRISSVCRHRPAKKPGRMSDRNRGDYRANLPVKRTIHNLHWAINPGLCQVIFYHTRYSILFISWGQEMRSLVRVCVCLHGHLTVAQ